MSCAPGSRSRKWTRRNTPASSANRGVISLQGLAPYWFETDAELFLGGPGTVGGRLKTEYDLLWTQRLITRPGIRLDWSTGSDKRNAVGAGVTRDEVELQTRYEITREFTPYSSLRYERWLEETAGLVRAKGRRLGTASLTVGLLF